MYNFSYLNPLEGMDDTLIINRDNRNKIKKNRLVLYKIFIDFLRETNPFLENSII